MVQNHMKLINPEQTAAVLLFAFLFVTKVEDKVASWTSGEVLIQLKRIVFYPNMKLHMFMKGFYDLYITELKQLQAPPLHREHH